MSAPVVGTPGPCVVFTGPTLAAEDGRAVLDAVYLPPVSQGDVYRAALQRPRAIGIVDGYFESVPSVWHKEILWAMAQGVHVFGSASMGALRAAELAPFGMVGVGEIFEAYRAGTLEDDDEVALAHGPADSGYRAHSEALVNIRATLRAAAAAGIIGSATHAALERLAKELYYPERAYPRLLERGASEGLAGAELDALRAWLPGGQVDQKRRDALAMLHAMREHLAAAPGPKQVGYHFEHTSFWENVRRSAAPVTDADGGGGLQLDALQDELCLQGDSAIHANEGALLRYLALGEARRQGWSVDAEALQQTADDFRRERGLLRTAEIERWLAEQQTTRAQFSALMRDESLLRRARAYLRGDARAALFDHLRSSGELGPLLARAQRKQQVLAAAGWENPGLAELGLSAEAALRWYFEQLGRPVPADLESYARAVGFADEEAFWRAVLREYAYVRALESSTT